MQRYSIHKIKIERYFLYIHLVEIGMIATSHHLLVMMNALVIRMLSGTEEAILDKMKISVELAVVKFGLIPQRLF